MADVPTLKKVKAMKVRLGIDDFGTALASVRYLRDLPVDKIAIHRSFVNRLGLPGGSTGVVTAMVNAAKSLGMSTAAQGVETEAQLRILTALGCSDAQGYYFSRPVNATTTSAILEI